MTAAPDGDPVTTYARDLAALFVSARDLLCDDAYAAVLPHLDALRLVLPDSVPFPSWPPRGPLRAVPDEPDPLDLPPR